MSGQNGFHFWVLIQELPKLSVKGILVLVTLFLFLPILFCSFLLLDYALFFLQIQ